MSDEGNEMYSVLVVFSPDLHLHLKRNKISSPLGALY